MKIVFMGTPDFSVTILDALVNAGHEIVCVYCQPPRPAGRGKKDRPSPVQTRASALGLKLRCPTSLKTPQEQEKFSALEPDIAVVVAYGLILPQKILAAPAKGCLNIHASLLPRWRGAAPIHRAIMAGDEKTGICIMQMDAGLDTGPVLLNKPLTIGAEETTAKLHDRLSSLGAKLILQTLDNLATLEPQMQPETGVTYANKIDKSEARIDWSQSANQVSQLIRGLSPFPGAWCMVDGERLKLLECGVVKGNGSAGEVLNGLQIACGNGAVEINKAQRQGKRPMFADELLRGFDLPEILD
jgi:methionyl-tRNA formyltransferase